MAATLGKTFGRSEHLFPLKGVGGDFSSASKSGSFVRVVRTSLHTEGWVLSTNPWSSLDTVYPISWLISLHQAGIIQTSSCNPSRSEAGVLIQGNLSALGLTELLEIGRRNVFLRFLLRWATVGWLEGAQWELQIFLE